MTTLQRMRLTTWIASRPIFVFLILGIGLLVLPCVTIVWWYKTVQNIEVNVELGREKFISGLLSDIDFPLKLLRPLDSSAVNLAKVLITRLDGIIQPSFVDVMNKVAPSLFQAFLLVPYLSQISYIGLNGLFLSYYIDGNRTLAVYANSTFNPNYTWFTQLVDSDTGLFHGEVVKTRPINMTRTNLFREGLKSKNKYPSIGTKWRRGFNGKSPELFLNTANVNGTGVVSLGFSVETWTDFFTDLDVDGGSLFLSTLDRKLSSRGIPQMYTIVGKDSVISSYLSGTDTHIGNWSCSGRNSVSSISSCDLKVEDISYSVYWSETDIIGIPTVYALAYPRKGLISNLKKYQRKSLTLLGIMIILVILSVFGFVYIMIRSARREMHLCASNIKHMEATQQAERKSMNKSLAFASASHDIRASLAGITGLIELSSEEVESGSELDTNLRLMNVCTQDLVDLLNSILDTSKIEAGKMQLEEEEFNLASVLEDVADLYHPVSIKKGVEVVLEYPLDESFLKFLNVKGDRGKLKQILLNLLSNAVKFTFEGNVTLRGWVKKTSLEDTIIASKPNRLLTYLSRWFYKIENRKNDMETVSLACQNNDKIEFVFEVDDTGKGIPKEKQKSVFENYVQVKETALGQGGTGLGLGIVQSLVRLMGGEICIVDKDPGEKGTCFRFNVFLQEQEIPSTDSMKEDIELEAGFGSESDGCILQHLVELRNRNVGCPKMLTLPGASTKPDRSVIVLHIGNEERRNVARRFFEFLGVNVSVVEEDDTLYSTLKKIRSESFPSSGEEGSENKNGGGYRKRGFGFSRVIVLVIDTTTSPFRELYDDVNGFRNGLTGTLCRVIWLNKPPITDDGTRSGSWKFDTSDDIHLHKPFHGSRLYQVLTLLPEYDGTLPKAFSSETFSNCKTQITAKQQPYTEPGERRQARVEPRNSSTTQPWGKTNVKDDDDNEKPLEGKHILVVDDNRLLRKIAKSIVVTLGATVEDCENGEKAIGFVAHGLREGRRHRFIDKVPFDYILMDCEMPEMNGYEAARHIREEEENYGVHIPIIALTAHTGYDATRKIIEAGMDAHLKKPLRKEDLLETLRNVRNK